MTARVEELKQRLKKARERVATAEEAVPGLKEPMISEKDAADLFREEYQGQLIYVTELKQWLLWDGATWTLLKGRRAFWWASELAKRLSRTKSVRSSAFASGVEKIATTDPAFERHVDQLDTDPWLCGTPGKTVDLRSGKLVEPKPEWLITKSRSKKLRFRNNELTWSSDGA
jgi:hypothetical protein